MTNETYKGHKITVNTPINKIGTQIVWSTTIDSKQIYKVFADMDRFLDEREVYEYTLEAIEDCKHKINMSEEIQNTEVLNDTEELVVTADSIQGDPAEANVCDSCQ